MGHTLIIEPAAKKFENGTHIVRSGKRIQFVNGRFGTSNPDEIRIIREYIKDPRHTDIIELPSIAEMEEAEKNRKKSLDEAEKILMKKADQLKAREEALNKKEKEIEEKEKESKKDKKGG